MDQQNGQRRGNRHSSRAQRNIQRRNLVVQRRNMVHYRVQNTVGNVTITNNYYFDMTDVPSHLNPGASYPPAALPPPIIVRGPNQSNAFTSGNLHIGYVTAQSVSYAPPQATHIAIPLNDPPNARMAHGSTPSPIILNGTTPRFVNISPRIANATAPGMMNVGAPGLNGIVRLSSPRQAAIMPRDTSSTAFLVTPVGTFPTLPSTVNAPSPSPMYVAIPSSTRIGSVSYQRGASAPNSNGVRITPVENMPAVEALQITEVVSSSVDEQIN